MDEFEELPCICLLLLWDLDQISLGFSENPQNISVQEASGRSDSNCWTWGCWCWTCHRLQTVAERQEEPILNQNLFVMKEQQGAAATSGCCLPWRCSHGVPGSCGDSSIPNRWQHLLPLVPTALRTSPQIPGFFELCAPDQLDLVKGFHCSTSQVIYSRVL